MTYLSFSIILNQIYYQEMVKILLEKNLKWL